MIVCRLSRSRVGSTPSRCIIQMGTFWSQTIRMACKASHLIVHHNIPWLTTTSFGTDCLVAMFLHLDQNSLTLYCILGNFTHRSASRSSRIVPDMQRILKTLEHSGT